MYPLLSLSQITLDPELARRLPRRLAYYHLALPIAQDDDCVTVAMAHPDNQAVIRMLETALGVEVTPVRSVAEDIKLALDRIWQENSDSSSGGILCWSENPAQAAYVREVADKLTSACTLPLLDMQHDSLYGLLEAARETRCGFIVAAVDSPETLADLLNRSPVSMLLVRGKTEFAGKILHVVRGHTPDRKVLDWVIPIAHSCSGEVTVLTAATPAITDYGSPLNSDFANLLSVNNTTRIGEYGQILASMNVQGRLKIRQGSLENAIVEEVSSRDYDLVAIAAEAYGDFVYRVLRRLSASPGAFLVVKP